jgi:hypothetical protein
MSNTYTVQSGVAFKKKKRGQQSLIATPYTWRDPKTIKPRDFLYGIDIVRGYVTGIVSMGGVGKTSEIQTEIAAMVTGRDLLGVKPKRLYRVWYINLEDPLEEIDRRMAAIFQHYGISEQDIGGRFFRDSGRSTEPGKEGRFVIAHEGRSGNIEFVQEAIDDLHATVHKNAIDFVVVDPFVNSARFAENDNNKMAAIIEAWAGLAEHQNCATGLVHHVRKGGAGHNGYTVEDARGAGALVNSCRTVRILNTMTAEEGEMAGIEQHRSYFRIDSGKTNVALPPDQSEWRKIVSVNLDNATTESPADRVGVVTLWKWPDPFANLTVGDLRKVQEAISAGGPWRANSQAKDWVGNVIAETLDLDLDSKHDKQRVKSQIKVWIKNGALKETTAKDSARRKKSFIVVGIWADTSVTIAKMTPRSNRKASNGAGTEPVPIKVGNAPEGVECVHCGAHDGRQVYKIRDGRVPQGQPGGRAECLHEGCAKAWFKGEPFSQPAPDEHSAPANGHVCVQCHCDPPDGKEQPVPYGDETIWLHAKCERAFISAKMREQGVS